MKRYSTILRNLALITSVIIVAQTIQAQGGQGYKYQQKREKIKAHRIAFITEKLDLSPEEAQTFWPVYNEQEAKMEEEIKGFREKYDISPRNILEISDKEAEELADAQLEHEQKMLNLKKEFHAQLKQILPPKKILMLIEADREFKVELMKRLSGRKGPGPGPGGR